MKRLMRYLMEHKVALLIVVLCFMVQAVCDLALPRFTSNIVDVGIQQSGVEDPSPTVMTVETHDAIVLLAASEDAALIKESYELSNGLYNMTQAGYDQRAALNAAIELPIVLHATGASSQQLDMALVPQQALSAAKAEYVKAGESLDDLEMSYLLRTGLAMMGVALLAFLAHCLMNFCACRTATKIGRDLRQRFFDKIVAFSDKEVDRFSAASLITRGTNDIQQIQMLCIMAQRMLVYTPIICIGGIIMVMQTNVSMTWIIALAVVVIVLSICILFAITMPKFKLMQKLIDKVNLVSREILTGLPVIRSFNREELELERFRDANYSLMSTQLFTNRAMTFLMPVMMLVMNAASVIIVWVGSQYVDMGTVQTGDLIAFITYSMVIVSSFLILGFIAIMIPRAGVAAERVDEVIESSLSIEDALQVYDEQIPDTLGAEVEFEDVCFRYADDSENVLDHVSFVAPAGKTTAIIGSTGSGKSTLLRLIERFYDVSEGSLKIDGVDVRDLSQKRLRSTFGYVPQQAFLFAGTVESNVGYSQDEPDMQRIQKALDIAQASDFVSALPEGVHAPIAQGGTNVSGGQRQRLAIARALATNARCYLFDDSFSALDYKTDAMLRQRLATELAGRTVIIVAQRIATVMNADQIIVLDEGRIAGLGTHDQLMEGCEAYREIAYSQLSEAELAKGGDK